MSSSKTEPSEMEWDRLVRAIAERMAEAKEAVAVEARRLAAEHAAASALASKLAPITLIQMPGDWGFKVSVVKSPSMTAGLSYVVVQRARYNRKTGRDECEARWTVGVQVLVPGHVIYIHDDTVVPIEVCLNGVAALVAHHAPGILPE